MIVAIFPPPSYFAFANCILARFGILSREANRKFVGAYFTIINSIFSFKIDKIGDCG